MLRSVLAIAGLLALIGLAAAWVHAPYAGFSEPVYVDIPKGTSPQQIGVLLQDAGVVWNRWQFLDVRIFRPKARLKAGEYVFKQAASPWDVFDRIARGDVFYYTLPVPEGNNAFDIAAALERARIMPAADFLAAVRDTSAIRDLDPKAPSLEGYLFPDTYRLGRHTTAAQLCLRMTERFRKAWRQLGSPKADVHGTVTLASLVEKEAKLPPERRLIASVFVNRLRIGMALQCDPTAIYAALVADKYDGTIHQSDLDRKQLYNTYQFPGLPPGPIANPGMDSLRAALDPAPTDYLYFVANPDGSGSHKFSKDLAEHVLAVQQYRREVKKEEREAGGTGSVSRAGATGTHH
ncbi:MAG: endolytic transglycosylase MltG [Bryobacteraceae bacterium]